MTRLLLVWHVRHIAPGYIQVMNDMVSPFIVVFLYENMNDLNMQTLELPKDFENRFTSEIEYKIEADTYHCFGRLMNNIKDNYTQGFPGVVKEMDRMKCLIGKLDQS